MKKSGLFAITIFMGSLNCAADAGVVEYGCSVMRTVNGESVISETPDLHIMTYNENNRLIGFLGDGSEKVTAVLCQRSSIIPAPYDYQVIEAGIPLYLLGNGRGAVLEFRSGKYSVRLLKGAEFSESEISAINAQLDRYPTSSSR